MADKIEVHCPSCGHLVKAPRESAGGWGKCPHCHNRVYVPTPPDELEELPLADEAVNPAKLKKLEAEAKAFDEALRKNKAVPDQPAIDFSQEITRYVLAMKNSNLDKADEILQKLKQDRAQSRSRVNQLMVDALPPHQLGDIPPELYQAFLRKLLESLET